MNAVTTYVHGSTNIHVIIETPRQSGNKYVYDEVTGLFKLKKILPLGMWFPLHFGFIPGTCGEDGDPLDAMVLMDEVSYPGCLLECRVLCTMEATQTQKGKTVRNDRVITAAVESYRYAATKTLPGIDKDLLEQLKRFFINYNEMEGKIFKVLGYAKKDRSHQLIKKSMNHG